MNSEMQKPRNFLSRLGGLWFVGAIAGGLAEREVFGTYTGLGVTAGAFAGIFAWFGFWGQSN
jgi:membrane associated rhomboid family serine protease